MNQHIATEGVRSILQDEIHRLIRDAIKGESIVHSGQEADRLASTYSDSGLSAVEISHQIIEAAIRAGVAIEMSRPANGKL